MQEINAAADSRDRASQPKPPAEDGHRGTHATCGHFPTAPGCMLPTGSSSAIRRPRGSAVTCAAGGSGRWARTCAGTATPRPGTGRRWVCAGPGR